MRPAGVAGLAGSSPRLRGTRFQPAGPRHIRRFIPAPAGNTAGGAATRTKLSVHPRACGEHLDDREVWRLGVGSSPRLRGTPLRCCPGPIQQRFIPAPAGNTMLTRSTRRSTAVHPRACGEHQHGTSIPASASGSSPRLRGTLRDRHHDRPDQRFIPAPAGNTWSGSRLPGETPVHPRACGEHVEDARMMRDVVGSSPRLRGTRSGIQIKMGFCRFIPAPAGNTSRFLKQQGPGPVHPRACGEHVALMRRRLHLGGSSPRLRGTHRQAAACRPRRRFIPAPAGNTARGP